MTKREAGAIGGRRTVERHGTEHMRTIGRRGFAALAKRLGYVGGHRRTALYLLIRAGAIPPPAELAPDQLAALAAECGLEETPW